MTVELYPAKHTRAQNDVRSGELPFSHDDAIEAYPEYLCVTPPIWSVIKPCERSSAHWSYQPPSLPQPAS